MQILELVIAFFCFPDVSIDFFDDTKFSSSDLLTLKKKKKSSSTRVSCFIVKSSVGCSIELVTHLTFSIYKEHLVYLRY